MAWTTVNLQAAVELLRFSAQHPTLRDLHASLGGEIARSDARVARAAQIGPEEFLDAIADDEAAMTEDLLGVAFVACQTFATRLRTRVARVSYLAERVVGRCLSFVRESGARDVLKLDSAPAVHGYTEVELLNGLANVWKHSSEWPELLWEDNVRFHPVWDVTQVSTKGEKDTIAVAAAVGMEPHNPENFRKAAIVLGVPRPFANLDRISRIMYDWATAVLARVKCEI
jgi:hypothetical protein